VSAVIALMCQCSPDCECTTLVDGVASVSEARGVAQDRGWYCTVVGGDTIDWAPGHREAV
jgi:hypothetical protein